MLRVVNRLMSPLVLESPYSAVPADSARRSLHVLHFIEALGPGGAERLLYTNLKHFDASRVRSSVFTVYPRATHWLEPIRELEVPVYSLNCDGMRDIPVAIRQLVKWLRANRPDVIHSHLWTANVIARVAGRVTGIPVVSSVHNPEYEKAARADGGNIRLTTRMFVKAMDRWTARFGASRLIAVSDYVRQSTRRHLKFSFDHIDLLYNPIDTDSFIGHSQKTRAEVLSECHLPPDSIMLLNVARLSPQKGLIHALRALPRILEKYPNVHLVSVGATTDPRWAGQLAAEATLAGVAEHFHVMGARRDVPDFLRACDLFVFPSLYEGLGIALIEAMAAGCSCVATAAGPIPEFVQHNQNGFLVPPADPIALADGICELLADPARRNVLSVNAKDATLERFQPKEGAERLMKIYEKVARRN